MYAAGMTVTSSSAAYVATLDSAITEGTPPIIGPRSGWTHGWSRSRMRPTGRRRPT
jgi:hypothetical protein